MKLTDSQKRFAGMALIIIFCIIELLFLFALIFTLVSGDGPPEDAVSFVFVMGIFAFPLWWGIKLWKASSTNSSIKPTVDNDGPVKDESTVISVQTKIELPEYRRMVFYNTYTHPSVILLHLIGISMLTYYAIAGSNDWFTLFFTLLMLYMPVSVYRNARSSYDSSKTVHENLSYTFTSQGLSVTGETVNFSIQWRSLFKVRETKSWFLLYTNKQNAMLIPKDTFASEGEVTRFRDIIPVEVVRDAKMF
jgi:hypothetical protein